VSNPVILEDGSILASNGYRDAEGIMVALGDDPPPIMPASPTREDAIAAVRMLLDLVTDFPFAADCHRSAWLAGLLTVMGRFAFSGPTPLFLLDANVPGSGKGMLILALFRIATGRGIPNTSWTRNDEEMRKRVTALARACELAVTLDNIDQKLGGAVLDSVLTSTTWADRILGESSMVNLPMLTIWFGSGNNVQLCGDIARRLCPIRLESHEERPEERAGFKYPNLLDHIDLNRPKLVGAALTIIKAFIDAGKPDQKLASWGSYEGWSALVRGAIVWADQPDPAAARVEMASRADEGVNAAKGFLDVLRRIDPQGCGHTAAQLVRLATTSPTACSPLSGSLQEELHEAIEQLAGKVDGRALGAKLKQYAKRIFGGYYLDRVGTTHSAARWAVLSAMPGASEASLRGESGESGESILALRTQARFEEVSRTEISKTGSPDSPDSPPPVAELLPTVEQPDDDYCGYGPPLSAYRQHRHANRGQRDLVEEIDLSEHDLR
jgi:hypothetical protein